MSELSSPVCSRRCSSALLLSHSLSGSFFTLTSTLFPHSCVTFTLPHPPTYMRWARCPQNLPPLRNSWFDCPRVRVCAPPPLPFSPSAPRSHFPFSLIVLISSGPISTLEYISSQWGSGERGGWRGAGGCYLFQGFYETGRVRQA